MRAIDCISSDDLDWVLTLPGDDPRQTHVRACPRCRALVDQYAAFLEAAPSVDAAQLADADARLGAALERALSTRSPRGGQAARRSRAAGWEFLLRPALRPAVALAALVVVVGVVVLWMRSGPHDADLRGGAGSAAMIAVERAARDAQGLRLAWQAVPHATEYEVRIYAPDLREIGRFETSTTSFTLSADHLPAANAEDTTVLCRIVALRDGDEIALSNAFAIERP